MRTGVWQPAVTFIDLLGRARRGWRGVADELFPRVLESNLAAARAVGWRVDPPGAYCRRCGATAAPGAVTQRGCPFCLAEKLPWDHVVRLGPYRAPLSQWIVAMKFYNAWWWCAWFGGELARVLPPDNPAGPGIPGAQGANIAVCPVPMPLRRRVRRGYNQAHLIAQALGRARAWPVAPLLTRRRYTPPQTAVPASQRPANVQGSIRVRRVDLSGWDVYLVDDVKTTGSTLRTCARLLRRAGASNVHLAVVAVADPRQVQGVDVEVRTPAMIRG